MNPSYEMLFETTIRSFLGEKAFHIAGQANTEKSHKKWYRETLKKIVKNVYEIETTTKHKEQLVRWSESALRELNEKPYNESVFMLYLLRLIGALLGLVGLRPYRIATLMYFPTPDQHLTEAIIDGEDALQDYYDEKNTVSVKKRIVNQLKNEGFTDFQISLVMNISEYQVKKLRKEL